MWANLFGNGKKGGKMGKGKGKGGGKKGKKGKKGWGRDDTTEATIPVKVRTRKKRHRNKGTI